jgi:hypothetical protein
MPFALAIVPVRKISSARHIVDKLKINAMHARSLNMFCFAMNFFAAIDEIAGHNRDDAGNECTTSLYIISANPWFPTGVVRLIGRWRLMRFCPNVAGRELSLYSRVVSGELCSLRIFSNTRIFPSLFRISKREKPHVAAEP